MLFYDSSSNSVVVTFTTKRIKDFFKRVRDFFLSMRYINSLYYVCSGITGC